MSQLLHRAVALNSKHFTSISCLRQVRSKPLSCLSTPNLTHPLSSNQPISLIHRPSQVLHHLSTSLLRPSLHILARSLHSHPSLTTFIPFPHRLSTSLLSLSNSFFSPLPRFLHSLPLRPSLTAARPVSLQATTLCPSPASAGFVMSSQLSGKHRVEFFLDPTLDYNADAVFHRFLSDFHNISRDQALAVADYRRGDPIPPMQQEMNVDNSKDSSAPAPYNLTLKDIVARLEMMAPLSLAEPWDNVGLLIEPHNTSKIVTNVMLTIDLTDEVLKEAVENKTDLIIAYHPPVFAPVKRVNNDKWKERIISTCLAHNIGVYSPHTSWDALQGGVNDWLGSIYDMKEYYPLIPSKPDKYGHMVVIGHNDTETDVEEHLHGIAKKAFGSRINDAVSIHPVAKTSTHVLVTDPELGAFLTALYAGGRKFESVTVAKRPLSPSKTTGSGRMIELKEPIPLLKAIKKMKAHLNKLVLRVALPQGQKENEIMINSIAVCAGSGGSLLKGVKADLYITGEMSHHELLDATHKGTTVLLLEHSDSERGYLKTFQAMLKVRLWVYLDPLQIHVSQADKDPIGYV